MKVTNSEHIGGHCPNCTGKSKMGHSPNPQYPIYENCPNCRNYLTTNDCYSPLLIVGSNKGGFNITTIVDRLMRTSSDISINGSISCVAPSLVADLSYPSIPFPSTLLFPSNLLPLKHLPATFLPPTTENERTWSEHGANIERTWSEHGAKNERRTDLELGVMCRVVVVHKGISI